MFEMFENKRGQLGLGDVPNATILIGLAVVIGSIMALLVTNIQDSSAIEAGSVAENVTTFGLDGLSQLFSQFGLIGLMIGLGVVLLVVIGVFGRFVGGRFN
jgi:uncharacterized membrane protein